MPRGTSKSICVDFDGTIFDHEYPEIGPIKPGVQSALQRLRDAGWWIVISSCRLKQARFETNETDADGNIVDTPFGSATLMAELLDEYGVPYDEISVTDKPYAAYYVDDKAIRLGCPHCGPNWPEIADAILEEQRVWDRLMGSGQ